MYNIDPKFFNDDGSINTEAAMAAGRKARARAAREGATEVKAFGTKLAEMARATFSSKASLKKV